MLKYREAPGDVLAASMCRHVGDPPHILIVKEEVRQQLRKSLKMCLAAGVACVSRTSGADYYDLIVLICRREPP